jgi:chromosome segregation ATPase
MSEVEQRAKEIRVQSIDLQEQLASQTAIKEKMEKKVADLELELKTIRAKWTQAQQGEIRAEQLENNVLAIQEEVELKHAKILSLETEVKELKLSIVSLKQEKEDWIRNKEAESQVELAKWKKEKKEWTDELEAKTRDLQQEAQDREDALRKEVVELRKRWQEAVQRADGMYIICPLPWYTTL